jgi:hypothetical protein
MAVENDLAELKGIGQKHAATLKEIGADLQGAAPPQCCQPQGDDRDPAREGGRFVREDRPGLD